MDPRAVGHSSASAPLCQIMIYFYWLSCVFILDLALWSQSFLPFSGISCSLWDYTSPPEVQRAPLGSSSQANIVTASGTGWVFLPLPPLCCCCPMSSCIGWALCHCHLHCTRATPYSSSVSQGDLPAHLQWMSLQQFLRGEHTSHGPQTLYVPVYSPAPVLPTVLSTQTLPWLWPGWFAQIQPSSEQFWLCLSHQHLSLPSGLFHPKRANTS